MTHMQEYDGASWLAVEIVAAALCGCGNVRIKVRPITDRWIPDAE